MTELAILEVAFGAFGLSVGVWHVLELKKIAREVGTHALKHFPYYVEDVTELIGKAKREIVIATDFPCYCTFSDPPLSDNYQSALVVAMQKKIGTKTFDVSVAWLDEHPRLALLEEQFKPNDVEDPRDRWKERSIEVWERLEHFVERHAPNGPTTAETITYSEFVKLLEKEHEKMASSLEPCNIQILQGPLQIYFWVIDKHEAIFAIPNFVDRDQGRGYYTRDRSIINGLLSVWQGLR